MVNHRWFERFWIGLSCSMLAGGFIGGVEAVFTLAGTDFGEYDAIFWGVFLYGLAGLLLGVPLGGLLAGFSGLRKSSYALLWSVLFWAIVLATAMFLSIVDVYQWICSSVAVFVLGSWIFNIFLLRTPLKIMLRPKGTLAMLLATLLVSGVFSLTPARPMKSASTQAVHEDQSNPMNVLMLIVDGLRHDQLYKGRSPHLDRFFSRSTFCEQAFSNSPQTATALMATLGSRNQYLHHQQAPEEMLSLAEQLYQAGYRTGAIVNDLSLGRFSNLHQGFEHYQYLPPYSPLPFTEGARRLSLIRWGLETWSKQLPDPRRSYRSSQEVFFHLRRFMSLHQQEKWFALGHFRELTAPFFLEEGANRRMIWPQQAPPNERTRGYQQELQRIDQSFGNFLRWMEQHDHLQNTIVIVFSSYESRLIVPHDKAFASIDHQQLRIPLALYLPQKPPQRIGYAVQLIDLPVTISHYLGLSTSAQWEGTDILHAQIPNTFTRPFYARFKDSQDDWSLLQMQHWKLIRRHEDQEPQDYLFNLRIDPKARRNLRDIEPQQYKKMQSYLQIMEQNEGR